MVILVYMGWAGGRRHVDSTPWAREIAAGRLYASPFEHEHLFPDIRREGWTTLPTRTDVLVEHRLGGSLYLGMAKDVVYKLHPGNAQLLKLLQSFHNTNPLSLTRTNHPGSGGGGIAWVAKDAMVEWLYRTLQKDHSARFLTQGTAGMWFLQSRRDAMTMIEERVLSQVLVPVLNRLIRETVEPLVTEWRYGVYQNTALAHGHAVPSLLQLQQTLHQAARTTVTKARRRRGSFVSSSTRTLLSRTLTRPVALYQEISSNGSTIIDKVAETTLPPFWFTRVSLLKIQRPVLVNKINPTSVWKQRSITLCRPDNHDERPLVREPAPSAWLHTGSVVQFQRGDDDGHNDWHFGMVVEVFADAMFYITTGLEEVEVDQALLHRLNPRSLIGKTVLLARPKETRDEEQDETEYWEPCRITAADYELPLPVVFHDGAWNHGRHFVGSTAAALTRLGNWTFTAISRKDGTVLHNIPLSDLKRTQKTFP